MGLSLQPGKDYRHSSEEAPMAGETNRPRANCNPNLSARACTAPGPAPRGPAPGTLQAPPHATPPLPPPEPGACTHRDALRERARPGARGPRSAAGWETRACGSGEGGPRTAKGLKCSSGAEGGSGWVSEGRCSCGPGAGERACWEPGGRVGGG